MKSSITAATAHVSGVPPLLIILVVLALIVIGLIAVIDSSRAEVGILLIASPAYVQKA